VNVDRKGEPELQVTKGGQNCVVTTNSNEMADMDFCKSLGFMAGAVAQNIKESVSFSISEYGSWSIGLLWLSVCSAKNNCLSRGRKNRLEKSVHTSICKLLQMNS
jgi:hypothetical protein